MNKLPVVSYKEVVKILSKAGFYIHYQKTSHIIMKRDNPYCRLVVPAHSTIKRGLLNAIIKQAGLTRGEFSKLLEEL